MLANMAGPILSDVRMLQLASPRYHGLGIEALANGWAGSTDVIMVLGMDALANGWAGSMDVIMVWESCSFMTLRACVLGESCWRIGL